MKRCLVSQNVSLWTCAGRAFLVVSFCAGSLRAAPPSTGEQPQFIVPGHEREMALLEELFALHARGRTACTLWDAWLPMSTLWAATGETPTAQPARDFYRHVFLTRRIDGEGYVDMGQHRGLAHSWGWPFPTWQQAGGRGWHFSLKGDEFYAGKLLGTPVTETVEDWQWTGCRVETIDPQRGLVLSLNRPDAVIETPPIDVDTLVAPFIRLEWRLDGFPEGQRCVLQWTGPSDDGFSSERGLTFDVPAGAMGSMAYTEIPAYRHPLWRGRITGLRLRFRDAPHGGSERVTLKSVITAVDSRHPITGALFVQGCCDYFHWTTDVDFLRANVGRMRAALQSAVDEFAVRENGCVLVPWIGHDGRPGFTRGPDGTKQLLHGHGVGNNYWDLLPFGHRDCLATIYLFDALNRLAALEQAIDAQPDWKIAPPEASASGRELAALAEHVRRTAGSLFWNESTGRFVASLDADANKHDYGFTFVNLEAIHYGFTTDEQARVILDWIDGRRTVAGDTSTGADIYHWRFAPRATTRRNIDWYVWAWHAPESIPWGGQVQDGGAVLGFSYFDLVARLKILGPDNARQRLSQILDWFEAVQAEGGYRAYYAKPGRGSLQGGGTPGGLGMDQEFMESVLVPQVMLYGFLGLRPQPGGFAVEPRLPSDWPCLTVTGIHVQDHVLDVTAAANRIEVAARRPGAGPLRLTLPEGEWTVEDGSPVGQDREVSIRFDRDPSAVKLIRKPGSTQSPR